MNYDNILSLPEVQEIARAADELSASGFAEAKAGNLSIRLDELPSRMEESAAREIHELPFPAPELSGRYLLVSARGSRMREVADDLDRTLILLKIMEDGRGYQILWGASEVTSEFRTHLAVHRVLSSDGRDLRAILHVHPPSLIATCHIRQFELKDYYIGTLFRMLPEARIMLPERFAVLPYSQPGSMELAEATAEAFKTHRFVLWEGHGAVAAGETLSAALDAIEVVEKAADIYLRILAVGTEPSV
jgi:rhamnulose-1-phosphate aldolase